MIGSLIEMFIYTIVALLAVKLVFFRKGHKLPDLPKTPSVSWTAAVESMTLMETRLLHLTERDVKQQERIWALEDTNRDLQTRLARSAKELLRLSPPTPASVPLLPSPMLLEEDIDDDDDANDSVPTNT